MTEMAKDSGFISIRLVGLCAAIYMAQALTISAYADHDKFYKRETLRKDAFDYMRRKGDRDRMYDREVYLKKLCAVIEADPSYSGNDRVLWVMAGFLKEAEPYAAIKVLKALVEKFPENRKDVILGWIGLGDIHFGLERREEARKYYEYVMTLDTSGPKWDGLREQVQRHAEGLAVVFAATARRVPRDPEESLKNLAAMREQYKDNPTILKGVDTIESRVRETMRKYPNLSKRRTGNESAPEFEYPVIDRTAIFETIAKIPSLKGSLVPGQFERISIVNAIMGNIGRKLNVMGIPVGIEIMHGEQPAINLALENVSLEEFADRLEQASPGYIVEHSEEGWTIRPRNSPLANVAGRFEVNRMAWREAQREVARQMETLLGNGYQVGWAILGMWGDSEDLFAGEVDFALEGSPYDALWALVRDNPPLIWRIYWRNDTTATIFPSTVKKDGWDGFSPRTLMVIGSS